MLVIDDIKIRLEKLNERFNSCVEVINIDKLKERKSELDILQSKPDLYDNLANAQIINSEAKYVSDKISTLENLKSRLDEFADFIEMIENENDTELENELNKMLKDSENEVENLYLTTLLSGKYDYNNAIMTLHAGAGGTDAQDWTQMLCRMYRMYCDKNDFSVEELDYLAGDEAGIKSVTFIVKGINAYGYLKAEKGVHRLVRISPFNSNGRRHTSFASVEVMPETKEDESIKILPDELNIDTYRSGGAGGQHVNKTDSAVRITHIPTGIVVQCQNERSQIQNRETAMKILISRLVELKEREAVERAGALKGALKKIEWGSQIRSYVFQPYTMVKDHRTGYEETDVNRVMNGDISAFIFEYLKGLN